MVPEKPHSSSGQRALLVAKQLLRKLLITSGFIMNTSGLDPDAASENHNRGQYHYRGDLQ